MNITLFSQGIADMAKALTAIWRQDYLTYRLIQANNAPKATYTIGLNAAGEQSPSQRVGPIVTAGVAIGRVEIAQSRQEIFSGMSVFVFVSSSAAFYLVDGSDPSPTFGIEIPAGGTILDIIGMDNIVNFRIVPQGGGTVNWVPVLYK